MGRPTILTVEIVLGGFTYDLLDLDQRRKARSKMDSNQKTELSQTLGALSKIFTSPIPVDEDSDG